MKRYIPNLITLLNLLSGSIAVIFAVQNNLVAAALFAFLGIFFDFFDGLMARKLNVASEVGVQLDSLSDVVTSGLVPGLVMYQLLDMATGSQTWVPAKTISESMQWYNGEIKLIPLLGLLITLASSYRLAHFNVHGHKQEGFIGLPTPANTLLIVSFPLIMEFQNNDLINSMITNQWFLIAVTLISCFLLNAPIRLMALKFKTWSFKDNSIRYLLIIGAIILLVIFQFAAIPLIILAYIFSSFLNYSS